MSLDVTTLTFTGGLITLSSGLFLLAYWFNDRTAKSALCWGIANCGLGTGVLLLSLGAAVPPFVSHLGAPFLIDASAVLTFLAALMFNRQSLGWWRLVGAVDVAIWIGTQALGGMYHMIPYAAAFEVMVSAGFYASAALSFGLARAEPLRGRIPMIVLIGIHAIARILLAIQFGSAADVTALPAIGLLGSINFVGLVYAIGVTMFLILMLNQRGQEKYKTEAITDSLTGLANRRGFLAKAQRVLDRAAQDSTPVALLTFDLDRFKTINDTFGHGTGDAVLLVFASTLSGTLRPTNIAARLGGEEFVAVVPGAGHEMAVAIAHRIREAFQKAAHFVDGKHVAATVSVGVAITSGSADPAGLAEVLASADAALYHAKTNGRNRVSLTGSQITNEALSNIIKIA